MLSHLKRWGILGAFTLSLAFLGCGEPGEPMAEPGPMVNDGEFGESDPMYDPSPEFPAPGEEPGGFAPDPGAGAPDLSPPGEAPPAVEEAPEDF